MSYATVMVSLTVDQSNEAVLEVAGQLAEKFDAKVIGIAAAVLRPPPYFMAGPSFMAGDFAKDFVDQGEASIRKRMSEIEQQFRAGMNGRAKNVGWRCSLELPARYIVREARAADIVVAAGDGDAIVDPFAVAGPNDLVMQVGRPLLVVPPSVRWLDLRSALVAWKDGAEARRAVADALPLLRKVGEVVVAAIAEDENDRSEILRQADDVVSWLARHGIQASSMVPERIGNARIQLDRIAADITAGLVVAGAYGHSRFREWVLGGVTQHLVEQDARCSLLSR
jgi:nucleotide-binding universal stress UspA family protein